ncbi:ABC transporter permease subunit [Virgibacillus litoralis]|uniref:Aldouronate transport system permease protein n=1 Tax=Virgibacillus litoralis TaxID=578221 RepID=A0ABS4HBL8_9BACI|nr:ABC transporter permease subunit [Virgibacillus litoralis]MBP1947882.1 putative aldouronate transport system permease protein [Virgibacillus litoralis]
MNIFKKHMTLYLMIAPVAIYFLLFAYYPLARGLMISFQEFRIIGDNTYIGLQNYITVLSDPVFWRVLVNTLLIGGGILLIGFSFPILVAISLNEVLKVSFKKFTQMVIYLPHLFSWVIIGGIWIYLLSPDGGLVNEIIKVFGGEPIHFFTQEKYAKPLMVFTAIWKDVGFLCILYLAAIVGISPTLYEAAKIDGATRWQEIRHILIPQLYPTMKVVFLLNLLGVLKIFDQIFIMRNPTIAREVDVLMVYTYEKGILEFDMGVATAASFFVIFATLILTLIARKLLRFDEEA